MSLFTAIAKKVFFLVNRKPLGKRASILSYHNIGNDEAFFTVSPSQLESQLKYLKDEGYQLLHLSGLVERLRNSEPLEKNVVLTFNDGYKSYYTEVFPLLKKYNAPATFFITPELMDTTLQTSDGFTFSTLSLEEFKEMDASDHVEFMPQTMHRVRLQDAVFDQAVEYIEKTRANLEAFTGKPAPIFSFTKGSESDQFIEYLRNHQWHGAVVTNEGLVSKETNPFCLPRNSINSKTSFVEFKGKIGGAIDVYTKLKSK